MEFLFVTDGLVCILSTIGTLWPETLYFKFQDQVKYLGGGFFCGVVVVGGGGFVVGVFWYVKTRVVKNVGVHCTLPISRNGVKLFHGKSFISTYKEFTAISKYSSTE